MNIINKYIEKFENKIIEAGSAKLENIYHIETPSKIDEFRAKLTERGGPAYNSKFIFALEVPNLLKAHDSLLSLLGITQFDEELAILGTKVSAQSRKLNSTKVPYYNNIKRNMPGGYEYNNLTITYIERNDRYIAKLFHEWMNKITDPVTNCGHFFNDVAVEGRILYYDKNDKTQAYINFQELVPLSVSIPTSDWSSQDLVSIDVEFGFTLMNNESFNLTSMLDSIENIRVSDLIQTIW